MHGLLPGVLGGLAAVPRGAGSGDSALGPPVKPQLRVELCLW